MDWDWLMAMGMGLIVGGIGLAKACVWWNVPDRRAIRQLRAVSTTPIAEAAEGESVRIVGTVEVAYEDVLEAPLTGRRCAGYVVEIFELQTKRTSLRTFEHGVVRLAHQQNITEFSLKDETGTALIKPDGARLVLVHDREETSSADPSSARMKHLLEGHGIGTEKAFFGRHLVYREAIIAPRERVSVFGVIQREMDLESPPTGGYRDRSTRVVMRDGGHGEKFVICDDPKVVGP